MAKKTFLRPKKLSDPSKDFSEKELLQIIQTPDSQLGFYELNALFQGYLPAGTYKEVVYFFPIALNYILEEKDEWFTLFDNLLVWVMNHTEDLKKDELFYIYWKKLSMRIKLILDSPFVIVKQDEKSHFYLQNSLFLEAVDSGIKECFTRFKKNITEYLNLEKIFNHQFKQILSYDCAAWFVYLENNCINLTQSYKLFSCLRLRQEALTLIYEKALLDELHCSFWDEELRYSLIEETCL